MADKRMHGRVSAALFFIAGLLFLLSGQGSCKAVRQTAGLPGCCRGEAAVRRQIGVAASTDRPPGRCALGESSAHHADDGPEQWLGDRIPAAVAIAAGQPPPY